MSEEDGISFLCHSCYNEENTDKRADKMSQVKDNGNAYDRANKKKNRCFMDCVV